ncbi:MAG: zf-HC2 domain-containing protein [bacterium]
MTCDDVQSALPALVTGLLPPAQVATIEAHAAGCPACQAAIEAERALEGQLRDACGCPSRGSDAAAPCRAAPPPSPLAGAGGGRRRGPGARRLLAAAGARTLGGGGRSCGRRASIAPSARRPGSSRAIGSPRRRGL